MPNPIMKYFEYAHLPEHLQAVSKPFGDLAVQMNEQLPDGAEKSAGLRTFGPFHYGPPTPCRHTR